MEGEKEGSQTDLRPGMQIVCRGLKLPVGDPWVRVLRWPPPVCSLAMGKGLFQQRLYPVHWLLGQLSKVMCLHAHLGE